MRNLERALFFAVPAAILGLTACDDESTTNVVEQTGLATIAAGEKLSKCSEDNVGEMVFVVDSAAVYYCDGEDWNTLKGKDGVDGTDGADGKDGIDGIDGAAGKDGVDGTDGDDGVDGKDGASGKSCEAVAIEEGYKIICGGDSVGVVLNGADGSDGKAGSDGKDGKDGEDGSSCTAAELDDGSGFELTCNGEVVGVIKNGADASSSSEVEEPTEDYGLGECTFERQGVLAQFTLDNNYYVCKVGSWQKASQLEIDTYGHECSADNENEVIKGSLYTEVYGVVVNDYYYYYKCESGSWNVSSQLAYATYGRSCDATNGGEVLLGRDNVYYYCHYFMGLPRWEMATQLQYDTYGHSCTSDNEGEVIAGNTDDSQSYTCTNKGWALTSTVNYGVSISLKKTYVWSGPSYGYRIETQFDDGYDESGYWYENLNNANVTYPASKGNEYDENAMDPIIDYCDGICGTMDVQESGYAAIGFNITGPERSGVDFTDYAAFQLAYVSTNKVTIALYAEDYSSENGWVATYELPATGAGKVQEVDILWSKFTTTSSTKTVEEIIKKLAYIQIEFHEEGETLFNVRAIGWGNSWTTDD